MNNNPLDEIYPQYRISELRDDRNYWYNQTQELCKSLERQDKVIDEYRKQNKEMKKLIQEIDNVIGDWEWHYCPNGTPQKAIHDLVWEYMKNK